MDAMDGESLDLYIKFVSMFREMDADLPLTTVAVFLTVVKNENMTMKEMSKFLNISQSSCSRNVAYLSQYHRLHKPGLNLLVSREDPMERRRKIVRLTSKGRRFVEKLGVMTP